MIRIEDLVAGPPPYVSEIKKPQLALVTNAQIEKVTRDKIERSICAAAKHIRWGESPTHSILLSAHAGEEYSVLTPINDDVGIRPAIGKAESPRFQAVVFQLMQEYGLNEGISVPDPSMSNQGHEDGIHQQSQGVAIEHRAFPSIKHPGLQFSRSRSYYLATREIISFSWFVSDELAPNMKIGPMEWYDREKQAALQAIKQLAIK